MRISIRFSHKLKILLDVRAVKLVVRPNIALKLFLKLARIGGSLFVSCVHRLLKQSIQGLSLVKR